MTTLALIRDRCYVGAGCWEWRGAMTKSNADGGSIPAVWHDGRTCSVLRVAYCLSGRGLAPGAVVWRTCGCNTCVNPKHLVAGTRAELGRWRVEAGLSKPTPDWLADNIRKVRARHTGRGGLSLEIAAHIRQSDATGRALARELGVSPGAISRVRRGTAWVEHAQGASVFGWRGQ